jgi:hypothetical protein
MPGALTTLGRRRLAVLLLPVATVAVHELRYLLAYGPGAGRELIAQGDAYVESLLPGVVLLLAVCFGAGLVRVWRVAGGRASGGDAPRLSQWRLWAGASVALLAAYVGQEALEVLLGSAHVSVLTQAFGDGGWWAAPAALTVGLGWALLARGARAVLALAARRAARRHRPAGSRPSRSRTVWCRPDATPCPARRSPSRRRRSRRSAIAPTHPAGSSPCHRARRSAATTACPARLSAPVSAM